MPARPIAQGSGTVPARALPQRILVTETQHLLGLAVLRSLGRVGHDVVAGFSERITAMVVIALHA